MYMINNFLINNNLKVYFLKHSYYNKACFVVFSLKRRFAVFFFTDISVSVRYTGCPLKKVGAMIESIEEVKEKKVLYYFANFAIINELLIIKNRRISPTYCKMFYVYVCVYVCVYMHICIHVCTEKYQFHCLQKQLLNLLFSFSK